MNPFIQHPAACQQFKAYLSQLQSAPVLFPSSDGALNPDVGVSHENYTSALTGYQHRPGASDKYDFFTNDPNFGHKLHLNVAIAHVPPVAEYLRDNRYFHKYLHGGEIDDGTIFTIYIGSNNLAHQLANKLSTELKGRLAKPIRRDEIEYAPNIIGRFSGERAHFHQYGLGLRGLSAHRYFEGTLWMDPETVPQALSHAFEVSFNHAARDYGVYFYGTGQGMTSSDVPWWVGAELI